MIGGNTPSIKKVRFDCPGNDDQQYRPMPTIRKVRYVRNSIRLKVSVYEGYPRPLTSGLRAWDLIFSLSLGRSALHIKRAHFPMPALQTRLPESRKQHPAIRPKSANPRESP
jgi:hypothetical protein